METALYGLYGLVVSENEQVSFKYRVRIVLYWVIYKHVLEGPGLTPPLPTINNPTIDSP